jgi:hypothetical protein
MLGCRVKKGPPILQSARAEVADYCEVQELDI